MIIPVFCICIDTIATPTMTSWKFAAFLENAMLRSMLNQKLAGLGSISSLTKEEQHLKYIVFFSLSTLLLNFTQIRVYAIEILDKQFQ